MRDSCLVAPAAELSQGHSLREAHVAGAGLAPESLRDFLLRTIGIDHAPETDIEWLQHSRRRHHPRHQRRGLA